MQLHDSVFDSFPVLTTKRLTLREIRVTDAPAIYAMRSNGRVNAFIPRPTMETPEQAAELATRTGNAFEQKLAIGWAGVLRDGTAIIGTCGFNSIDFVNLRAEIGGEMDVNYWGKHLPYEAVSAIVHFGFHTLGLHSIEAKVAPENRGAIYLLEQLGFQKEAHFKDRIYANGAFLDMAVYSAIRSR